MRDCRRFIWWRFTHRCFGAGNWNIFDLLVLSEGTVTSTYVIQPPIEN